MPCLFHHLESLVSQWDHDQTARSVVYACLGTILISTKQGIFGSLAKNLAKASTNLPVGCLIFFTAAVAVNSAERLSDFHCHLLIIQYPSFVILTIANTLLKRYYTCRTIFDCKSWSVTIALVTRIHSALHSQSYHLFIFIYTVATRHIAARIVDPWQD